MPSKFISGKSSIEVRVTRASGSALFLRSGNLPILPTATRRVKLLLPDKSEIAGKYTVNPINPFIGGPDVPEWIRSVVPPGKSVDATLTEVAPGVLQVRLHGVIKASNKELKQRAAKLDSKIRRYKPKGRRRKVQRDIERWERDPMLRDAVLGQWPTSCQIDGCSMLEHIPFELREALLEIHHVTHISRGGTDDADNLTLLCANHHKLVHFKDTIVVSEAKRKVVLEVPIAGEVVIRRPPLVF
jgi:hypothetical protein